MLWCLINVCIWQRAISTLGFHCGGTGGRTACALPVLSMLLMEAHSAPLQHTYSLSLEGADFQPLSLSCAQGAGQGCELSPPLLCRVGSKEFAKPGRACDTQLMTFSLPVFPLRQKSECLLSLEAYSQEQKKRICWCLAENITKQQHPAAAPTESKVRDPRGS